MHVITRNLNAFCAERGWQEQHFLAALADAGYATSTITVQRWLDGTSLPRTRQLPLVAAALGVEVADLFREPVAAAAE